MAATTNYAMTLLEVGQKEKEVTINTNFTTLDNTPKYLGDLASDPASVATTPVGSTYYNTATSKLKVLRSKSPTVVWSNVA
jgi:hypothetical protein